MFNTPDSLLIQLGLQLPENLNGEMVIGSDSSDHLCDCRNRVSRCCRVASLQSTTPIAAPDSNVALLASDQCGVSGGAEYAR